MLHDRDYIMRIVREFAATLAKILSRRNEAGQAQTLAELDELAGRFVGLGLGLLEVLPAGQLQEMLSHGGLPDPNRVYAAGRLLEARGTMAGEAGDAEYAAACNRKALRLLIACHDHLGGYLNDEHEQAVARLTEVLG